jgi:hypothetical protein
MTVAEQGSSTTKYFNFETNGDISEYQDFTDTPPLHSLWVTYPIQSQGTNSVTFIDTTIITGGISTHIVSKVTMSYEGVSSLPIYDSTLSIIKIKAIAKNIATSSVQNQIDSAIAHYYFAPSIGYIAKLRQEPGGLSSNGSENTLIRFTLR